MSSRSWTAALLLAGLAAIPLASQTVVGRVVDAASGEGVPLARVQAVNGERHPVGRATTDTQGRFSLGLREGWTVRLQVERTGYSATLTQTIEVGPRDTLEVTVRVSAQPLQTEPLTVTARRQPTRRAALTDVGFYDRERLGFGRFLHREDLERGSTTTLARALDRVPGTTLIGRGPSEVIVFDRSSMAGAFRRAQGGGGTHCLPEIYLDGARVAYDNQGINGIIEPERLEAVEVYGSAAQLPPRFNGPSAACGVIVLWSRKEP